jgi:hypothetical protein
VKIDKRFPLQVLGALIVVGCAGAYPMIRYGSPEILIAASVGTLLSTVNVLVGFFAIEYSFNRSYTTFLKTVLGGMGVRMALMLVALLVLIKAVGLHTVALTVSLLGFHLIFLILEVLFIHKKVVIKNQS